MLTVRLNQPRPWNCWILPILAQFLEDATTAAFIYYISIVTPRARRILFTKKEHRAVKKVFMSAVVKIGFLLKLTPRRLAPKAASLT